MLIYLLNSGYSQEIINWGQRNPNCKIEAFWNKPDIKEYFLKPNIKFHHLSGQKFIEYLAACRAFISTAGFDSISEAAYLQKNILMVPTKNHFEQKCNAADAKRVRIALTAETFNLSLINGQIKTHSENALASFKEWVDKYDNKLIKLITK